MPGPETAYAMSSKTRKVMRLADDEKLYKFKVLEMRRK